MKLLNDYFNLQEEIYDYFGYKEDWVVIPLQDYTAFVWYLEGEGYGDSVLFAHKEEDFPTEDYYSAEIYPQRFLPKWVYETKDYTMIVVDTNTDGNKFLAVFDNDKKLTELPEIV